MKKTVTLLSMLMLNCPLFAATDPLLLPSTIPPAWRKHRRPNAAAAQSKPAQHSEKEWWTYCRVALSYSQCHPPESTPCPQSPR
ncbi:hypothetical protein [Rugamonas aquatica]|uniref:Uncharacterized protein n=1 Tax=Rugamonas aquatica TaxID=2743357 RepID=A0A6A7N8P6_9BURK|nr:hypothetical protein [Rugamonas aquatica]MQA41470.1 hypothetical protein [Rugamonas aquatica]